MAYQTSHSNDGRVPLLLYSGGMDSTLMLALETSDGKQVDTLYVDGSQAVDKIQMEFRARAGATQALEEHYKKSVVRFSYEHRVMRPVSTSHQGFSQLLPWFTAAMDYADPQRHCAVLMGYVAGDQMVSQLHHIEAAWNALFMAMSQTTVPIKFPLKFATKREIYESLTKHYPMLKDHYWYCENPAFKLVDGKATTSLVPCQCCASCMTHNAMLYAIQQRDEAHFTRAHNFAASRLLTNYSGTLSKALEQHAESERLAAEALKEEGPGWYQQYLDFSALGQQKHIDPDTVTQIVKAA